MVKMKMEDIIFDMAALHGRDAAKSAADMIINNYKDSELSNRRDEITKELLSRKEGNF